MLETGKAPTLRRAPVHLEQPTPRGLVLDSGLRSLDFNLAGRVASTRFTEEPAAWTTRRKFGVPPSGGPGPAKAGTPSAERRPSRGPLSNPKIGLGVRRI